MDMQTTALAPYRSASSRIDRSIKAHCNYTHLKHNLSLYIRINWGDAHDVTWHMSASTPRASGALNTSTVAHVQ